MNSVASGVGVALAWAVLFAGRHPGSRLSPCESRLEFLRAGRAAARLLGARRRTHLVARR